MAISFACKSTLVIGCLLLVLTTANGKVNPNPVANGDGWLLGNDNFTCYMCAGEKIDTENCEQKSDCSVCLKTEVPGPGGPRYIRDCLQSDGICRPGIPGGVHFCCFTSLCNTASDTLRQSHRVTPLAAFMLISTLLINM